MRAVWWRAGPAGAGVLAALAAGQAAADTLPTVPDPIPTVEMRWRLTDETYDLPAGERMGMTALSLLVDAGSSWRLGPSVYAATRGERGGFITLGVAGEWHHGLSRSWDVHAGLFVGGGGGRGGYQLAGGGLMLRGDLGLSYAMGEWGRIGFGVSHVDFPSGTVTSTQPYVLLERRFDSLSVPGWVSLTGGGGSAQPAVRAGAQEFSVVLRRYDIPDSVVQDNGAPQHGSMQLAGAEWLAYLDDPRWFVKVEAAGASGGESDGYMQVLAGGGWRWQPWRGGAFKVFGVAGGAGGGRVDTGGGFLVEAGASWQQALTRDLALELAVGEVRAPSASFRARSLALKITHPFGLPQVGADPVPASDLGGYEPRHLRVRVANQTYVDPAPGWRRNFPDETVNNLGVQLDYFASRHWFLSGQGLAAYTGKAGSYMVGLVGGGVRADVAGPVFAEAELLAGAAGGGGLNVGGGAVVQGNLSLGWQLSRSVSLMASVGHLEAPGGELRTQVAGLALGYSFSTFSPR